MIKFESLENVVVTLVVGNLRFVTIEYKSLPHKWHLGDFVYVETPEGLDLWDWRWRYGNGEILHAELRQEMEMKSPELLKRYYLEEVDWDTPLPTLDGVSFSE